MMRDKAWLLERSRVNLFFDREVEEGKRLKIQGNIKFRRVLGIFKVRFVFKIVGWVFG